eukprot:5888823-Pleurochrysis_carterae.AAC.2
MPGNGGTGSRELWCGPAMWQVMQQCEERNKVVRGPEGSCKCKIHNHGTGRAGTATAKTVLFIRLTVSRAAESSTAAKAARYPRARRRARRKSCSLE